MVYLSLFILSFLAATFLPVVSEAVLYLNLSQGYNAILLWSAASVGNTLGSVFNYVIGYKGEEYLESKGYLPHDKMQRARAIFSRYGGWSLLLSWAPVIGDPLTFVAGVLHYRFWWFVVIVAVAKATRYAIIVYVFMQ